MSVMTQAPSQYQYILCLFHKLRIIKSKDAAKDENQQTLCSVVGKS